ncbi:hypothetical protein ACFL4P_00330 [Gemmatimonadota bacterium]
MKISRLYLITILLFLFAAVPDKSSAGEQDDNILIRGVYGGVKTFWQSGARLDEYGINGVFTGSYSINEELVSRVHAEGAKIFSEFATLNGQQYLESHPEAWPIDQNGERSLKATWFMGICPTNPQFKQYRMSTLRQLLQKFDLDGIWMDYVHWHAQFEDPHPILPETCFCDHCLAAFETSCGISLPAGSTAEKASWILEHHDRQWRDWRCSVVTGWARDMKRIIRQERPGALLGIFHCPWDDEEFDGARRRILGLDFKELAEVVDVFSPMVYHGRMGRKAEWVKDYLAWFCESLQIDRDTSPRVWPIVQASDEPGPVSPAEFEKVLRYGVTAGSTGVMMFTIHSVARDSAKMETMKKVYNGWKKD